MSSASNTNNFYCHSLGDIVVAQITTILKMDSCISQLILTCISTGGPATTVTWTRDSTTVTQGTTETVLNDPVTAQYTHTLTVTGTLRGNYTCTVSNSKPSSKSSSIIVSGKYGGNRDDNGTHCWFIWLFQFHHPQLI